MTPLTRPGFVKFLLVYSYDRNQMSLKQTQLSFKNVSTRHINIRQVGVELCKTHSSLVDGLLICWFPTNICKQVLLNSCQYNTLLEKSVVEFHPSIHPSLWLEDDL